MFEDKLIFVTERKLCKYSNIYIYIYIFNSNLLDSIYKQKGAADNPYNRVNPPNLAILCINKIINQDGITD